MESQKFKKDQKIQWNTLMNGKVTTIKGCVVSAGEDQINFGFMAEGNCIATGKFCRDILYIDDRTIINLQFLKTLKLTLKRQAFEVMVTGEKTEEYRKRSQWILSRLWQQDKSKLPIRWYYPKTYDYVEFTNGYGNDKPKFTAEFIDFLENLTPFTKTYSNGLKVAVDTHDQIIRFGKIIKIENYDPANKRSI